MSHRFACAPSSAILASMASFDFLLPRFPRLHRYASHARDLAESKPENALERLRKLAEAIVAELLQRAGISSAGHLVANIKLIERSGGVPVGELERLDHLRKAGNMATHDHDAPIDSEVAVAAVGQAHALCSWFIEYMTGARASDHQPDTRPPDLVARLRQAVVGVPQTAGSAGLATRAGKPSYALLDIFVPRVVTSVADGTLLSLDDFASRLLDETVRGVARTSLVAPVGQGKTMLCRRLVGVIRGSIPIHVPLRGLDGSLLDHMTARLLARMGNDAREALCEALRSDRVVVLADGFDEISDAKARARASEAFRGFAVDYPNVPILITSREEALHELDFEAKDDRWRLLPLDRTEGQALIDKLFKIENVGPQSAATAFDDRLRAQPTLRQLTSSPLLLTLLVRLQREDPAIPGRVVDVFERCARTLVDGWPSSRGMLHGVYDGRDLYRLALAFLERGAGLSGLMAYQEAVRLAAELGDQDEARAQDWIEHLVDVVGILEDDGAGALVFSHWGFMEYLAARALSAQGLVERWVVPRFRQVRAMALAIHQDDHAYLSDVSSRVDGWGPACVDAIMGGAKFAPAVVDDAIAGVAAAQLAMIERAGVETGILWADEYTGPARAVAESDAWCRRTLKAARGSALAGGVALAVPLLGPQVVLDILATRSDTSCAARVVARFWPANTLWLSVDESAKATCWSIGDWGIANMDEADAADWADSLAPDDVVPACLAALALSAGSQTIAALSVRLTRHALTFGGLGGRSVARLTERTERPHSLASRPGDLHIVAGLLAPVRPWPGHVGPVERAQPSGAASVQRVRARLPALSMPDFPSLDSPPPALQPEEALRHAVNATLPDLLDTGMVALANADVIDATFFVGADLEVSASAAPVSAPPRSVPVDYATVFAYLGHEPRRVGAALMGMTRAAYYAEAMVGIGVSSDLTDEERRLHVQWRWHNRWLNATWPRIQEFFRKSPTREKAGLVMALAWTSHMSTGRWPADPEWCAWFGADDVDGHWLAVLHWHLSWLSHDPGMVRAQQGVRRALAAGVRDPRLRGIAEEYRRLLA